TNRSTASSTASQQRSVSRASRTRCGPIRRTNSESCCSAPSPRRCCTRAARAASGSRSCARGSVPSGLRIARGPCCCCCRSVRYCCTALTTGASWPTCRRCGSRRGACWRSRLLGGLLAEDGHELLWYLEALHGLFELVHALRVVLRRGLTEAVHGTLQLRRGIGSLDRPREPWSRGGRPGAQEHLDAAAPGTVAQRCRGRVPVLGPVRRA